MTDARDTTEERLADYRRLFGKDLLGRWRTPEEERLNPEEHLTNDEGPGP